MSSKVADGADADLERDLAVLRRAYERKLPAKLASLEGRLRGLRAAPDPAGLAEARRQAHTLKGTSGSYGLDVVSADFERIEERLEELIGGNPDPELPWSEIEDALRRLRVALGVP